MSGCLILFVFLAPVDQLDKVSQELSGLPEGASQKQYFDLLHSGVTTSSAGDESSVRRCSKLLRDYMARCSKEQRATLLKEFDDAGAAILKRNVVPVQCASVCVAFANFYRRQAQMRVREINWLVKEVGYRRRIASEQEDDQKNLNRLVAALINISELCWSLGDKENALAARTIIREYVDPTIEDANSLTYLSQGAALSFRMRKYDEAIEAYKLILARKRLSSFDRTRMHMNLAETFRGCPIRC
jgi:tetratricopeptide (TPR) repeat protein